MADNTSKNNQLSCREGGEHDFRVFPRTNEGKRVPVTGWGKLSAARTGPQSRTQHRHHRHGKAGLPR